MRASPAQLRALHAEGRRRGLSHDDLRALVGVASLADASGDQVGRALDRLRGERPAPPRVRRYRPRVTPAHVIRPASPAQRAFIRRLLAWCGLPEAWLASRSIDDLDRGAFTSRAASEVIEALKAIHGGRVPRPAEHPLPTESRT